MAYHLQDRVIFITGASRGIGRACAIEFHRAGCRVVVAARSKNELVQLAEELGTDRVLAVEMDVTSPAQRETAIKAGVDRFGTIDVLVNNAGWGCFASVQRTPADLVEQMLALNYVAPIAMTQLVLPEMIGRGSGQIINISSVVGNQPIPRMTVYSSTKAALSSLSAGLRMELKGTGVDVLLVSPGSTDTPFFETATSIDVDAVRLGQNMYSPERVARAVVRSSRRRRREVTLTPAGWLITCIRRVSHRVADYLVYQTSKRAMPTREMNSTKSHES